MVLGADVGCPWAAATNEGGWWGCRPPAAPRRLRRPPARPPRQSPARTPQGVRAVVFGVPDMGKVCSATHVPSYLEQAGGWAGPVGGAGRAGGAWAGAPALRHAAHHRPLHSQAGALKKAGVDRIICVGSGDPEAVLAWATSLGADGSTGVAALADRDGAFARMLGVEAPAGAPYATHRYAALVEDGILLKLARALVPFLWLLVTRAAGTGRRGRRVRPCGPACTSPTPPPPLPTTFPRPQPDPAQKVEKAPGDCVNTRGEELLACARDFFVA